MMLLRFVFGWTLVLIAVFGWGEQAFATAIYIFSGWKKYMTNCKNCCQVSNHEKEIGIRFIDAPASCLAFILLFCCWQSRSTSKLFSLCSSCFLLLLSLTYFHLKQVVWNKFWKPVSQAPISKIGKEKNAFITLCFRNVSTLIKWMKNISGSLSKISAEDLGGL